MLDALDRSADAGDPLDANRASLTEGGRNCVPIQQQRGHDLFLHLAVEADCDVTGARLDAEPDERILIRQLGQRGEEFTSTRSAVLIIDSAVGGGNAKGGASS
ncbi:hypothetical protein [Leekyejoonella antrihumi]|uniref:Uncharacterized protein n=1 Tax=Leekyejoonella antrihumi TaxID=1660198 RepID=A0A563E2S3_9MICO|nr:hypothetical protein [Leekyejoonella antrihumi]TWP36840.1 hypothetical protein FGL98_08785 [Leekyejoonella antrihumi]